MSDPYLVAKNNLLSYSRKDVKKLAENIIGLGVPVSAGYLRAMMEVLDLRKLRVEGWNK